MEREPRFAERDDGGRRTTVERETLKRVSCEEGIRSVKRETILILIFNF